jgi:hypothetical protein
MMSALGFLPSSSVSSTATRRPSQDTMVNAPFSRTREPLRTRRLGSLPWQNAVSAMRLRKVACGMENSTGSLPFSPLMAGIAGNSFGSIVPMLYLLWPEVTLTPLLSRSKEISSPGKLRARSCRRLARMVVSPLSMTLASMRVRMVTSRSVQVSSRRRSKVDRATLARMARLGLLAAALLTTPRAETRCKRLTVNFMCLDLWSDGIRESSAGNSPERARRSR